MLPRMVGEFQHLVTNLLLLFIFIFLAHLTNGRLVTVKVGSKRAVPKSFAIFKRDSGDVLKCGPHHYRNFGDANMGKKTGSLSGEANIESWSWVVQLEQIDSNNIRSHLCTGSLVTFNWVITSADCLKKTKMLRRIGILIGRKSKDHNGTDELVMKVNQGDIFLGPGGIQIGLLRLPPRYQSGTGKIQTACIPDKPFDEELLNSCFSAGWDSSSEGTVSTKMQFAKRKLIAKKECTDSLNGLSIEHITLTQHTLCAKYEKKEACSIDMGSPLQCEEMGKEGTKKRWELTGIALETETTCGYPAVFTKIGRFREWISDTIKENPVPTPAPTQAPTTTPPFKPLKSSYSSLMMIMHNVKPLFVYLGF